MIDIHCHILPGLDDGPDCPAHAIKMAEQAMKSGIDTIIATPHFLDMIHEVSMDKIKKTAMTLQKELLKKGLKLKIFTGAEIRMVHNICQLLDKGCLPSLAESNYYLFELPEIFIPDSITRVLKQLNDRNVIPVIAHPERNYSIMKNPVLIKKLKSVNIKFQLTGQSILGKNGKTSLNIAKQMVKDSAADFIGSDGHNTSSRKPCFKNIYKAITKIAHKGMAQKIMIENPEQIFKTSFSGKAGRLAG